jgi:hypothetical protein
MAGMATQWAARRIVAAAQPKTQMSDSFVDMALQQGAAIGVGKFFHGKLASWKQHRAALEKTPRGLSPEGQALLLARDQFFERARALAESASPDPSEGPALQAEHEALVKQELELFGVAHGKTGNQPDAQKSPASSSDASSIASPKPESSKSPIRDEAEKRTKPGRASAKDTDATHESAARGKAPSRPDEERLWVKEADLQVADHVTSKEWTFSIEAPLPNGRSTLIAYGTVELGPGAVPIGGPEFVFEKRTTIGGKQYRVTIGDETAGQSMSLSDIALDQATKLFKARYGHDPDELPGHLAFENKANFQREYLKAIDAGMPPKEAEVAAVKAISFGRARVDRGYANIEVHTTDTEVIMYGEPPRPRPVPKNIDVKASRK